jgi:hypothetical protein
MVTVESIRLIVDALREIVNNDGVHIQRRTPRHSRRILSQLAIVLPTIQILTFLSHILTASNGKLS